MNSRYKTISYPKGDWDGSVFLLLTGNKDRVGDLIALYSQYAVNSVLIEYWPHNSYWFDEKPLFHLLPSKDSNNEYLISRIESIASSFGEILRNIKKHDQAKKIFLVGNGIGGCIALKIAMMNPLIDHTICHNGCLFSIHQANSKFSANIDYYYYKKDKCFSCEDRYLPTIEWLKNHNLSVTSYDEGKNEVRDMDVEKSCNKLLNFN